MVFIDVPVGHVFYGNKCKLLVIHLGLNGQLSDSKPCCMCINLMKRFGINRVYYSTNTGDICCQKISELDDGQIYVSHGLALMIDCYGTWIRTQKLPLTRAQKTALFHLR